MVNIEDRKKKKKGYIHVIYEIITLNRSVIVC